MRIKHFWVLMLVVGVLFAFCACASPSAGEQTPGTTAPKTEQTPAGQETPAGEQASKPTEEQTVDPTEDDKVTYTVKVVDGAGAPMASVMVQICHSNGCFAPAMTDAEGVATFDLAEGQDYKATFTSVPEGYTAETADVYFEGATEVTLVLAAA